MPQPDPPPESIILGTFAGVKNTVAPERLRIEDLEAAVNIDLDDSGQPRRRRGFALHTAGNWHSARTLGDRSFAVKDGVLGELRSDLSFAAIQTVGLDKVAYELVGDVVYYASRSASGKILPDDTNAPWGAFVSEGAWLSPVVRPTETLGAIRGKLLGAPPLATDIALYRGRLYMMHERLIWATELYLYDLVDKTRNFIQLDADGTMLAAMDDGIYVGTTAGLYFLQGTFSTGLKRSLIADAAVIPGSLTWVPTSKIHPQARQGAVPEGVAAVFLTAQGICAAFDGGQVFNLTQERVVFPGVDRAAALYREQDGANTYIAVADSGGDPVAKARIGDYIDAEIRRASQGG